jgi:hypothetical protein
VAEVALAQPRVFRRWPAILAILLLAHAAASPADAAPMQDPNVDPPAAHVVPDHEQIGTPDYPVHRAVEAGRQLFRAKFNRIDGAGRPAATGDSKPTPRRNVDSAFQRVAGPDASSCSGCHNEPRIGGSGDFAANVFVGAHLSDPPTDRIDASMTSERNTVSLFGSGVVELVAREMTVELQAERDRLVSRAAREGIPVTGELRAKGTGFGSITALPDGLVGYQNLEGVDFDLIVRPFGIKGVAASLREFSTFALNQHHGMQAVERFGWERTGRLDFDEDGKVVEFTIGQVTALVLFQASLPVPNGKDPPGEASRGRLIFDSIGCARCHVPRMFLRSTTFSEPGPFNRPGALSAQDTTHLVHLPVEVPLRGGQATAEMYSDLRRHRMCDEDVSHFCNEIRRQDNVPTDQFMTPRLWDLATSAPYCHRGDCSTLSEAILAHGGEGRSSRERFRALPSAEQKQLVEFLLSLGAGQTAGDQ